MVAQVSEVVGLPGMYETLRRLVASAEVLHDPEVLADEMLRAGVDDPVDGLEILIASGILHRRGDLVAVSTHGIRTSILLDALNGGDLKVAFDRLARLDEGLRMYELVREGMTSGFLRTLSDRPGFRRLYFCSPWINLDLKEQRMLAHALGVAERRGRARPEIYVITRPDRDGRSAPATLAPFRSLGASLYLHSRLHTKLYIREPDAGGGLATAIVGSQNLTASRWLELGIRINGDGQMINQLIRYFWDLTARCAEA